MTNINNLTINGPLQLMEPLAVVEELIIFSQEAKCRIGSYANGVTICDDGTIQL